MSCCSCQCWRYTVQRKWNITARAEKIGLKVIGCELSLTAWHLCCPGYGEISAKHQQFTTWSLRNSSANFTFAAELSWILHDFFIIRQRCAFLLLHNVQGHLQSRRELILVFKFNYLHFTWESQTTCVETSFMSIREISQIGKRKQSTNKCDQDPFKTHHF